MHPSPATVRPGPHPPRDALARPVPVGVTPAEVPTGHVPTRTGAARRTFAEYPDTAAANA
ncbi:hypothetical protein WHI96_12250 [Pseudonocardia tropica]|uniref:Uncharacterized protein n=1 Tax=Pseudonocardia tropica TaxID=681289 RepID=A0ABV1JUH9_9PSEU